MFLGVLLKEGSHFQLLLKNWLKISQETLKLDNIPSIRYRIIWSHHVPNVKQHVRLCLLQLLIYCKNQKKLLFFADGSKIIHSVILFFRFFKIENCSEKQVLPKTYKSSHQEVFSKIGVLKILTSHNGLYEI